MRVARFFIFLLVIFVISALVYAFTTPGTKEIQFTGIIMGNDYIASPLVQGRLDRLLVQEGSFVKKGELDRRNRSPGPSGGTRLRSRQHSHVSGAAAAIARDSRHG